VRPLMYFLPSDDLKILEMRFITDDGGWEN
jgi:hypothetical protein